MSSRSTFESGTAESDPCPDLERLLGDVVRARDDHLNAPGVVIRPDEVQSVLATLRDDAGFDHCSCVTAQQYPDRFETIDHLKSYDDPTREVSVVVPTSVDDPLTSSTRLKARESSRWGSRLMPNHHTSDFLLRV